MKDGKLTFDALREANVARLPLFKDKHGNVAHSEPDGSDWTLGEWMNAILGELGEAANIVKKIKRGDVTLEEARDELAKEFADVATYLDIAAFRAGVDLGEATKRKWNMVSERVGCDLRIGDSGLYRIPAGEQFLCPRREEIGGAHVFHLPEFDHWRDDNGVPTCSFCGSVSPERFLEHAKDGVEVVPTDKNYKAYIGPQRHKFYFQHFDEAQRREFIDMLNNKVVKFAYPGHFYKLPFFIHRG